MTERQVIYQQNNSIVSCPHCGNNTMFTVKSDQVQEDCCEIWAVCKCGFDPTSAEECGSDYRIEDVWGGCDDQNCYDAVMIAWNQPIKDNY